MPAVRVMQMPFDQVVAVIGVRDDLVPAARAVSMGALVLAAGVGRRAGHRIRPSRDQGTLVHVVVVHVMEVAIVEVVGVVTVPNGRVPAVGSVRVIVSVMGMVLSHGLHLRVTSERESNGSMCAHGHNIRRQQSNNSSIRSRGRPV